MSTRMNPSNTQIRRLNRRQSKKLRVGEFQELGVEIKLAFVRALPEAEVCTLAEAFIEFVEARQLMISGFTGSYPVAQTQVFVTRDGRGSVSEEDVVALVDWLKAREEVADVKTDGRVDAWYGF